MTREEINDSLSKYVDYLLTNDANAVAAILLTDNGSTSTLFRWGNSIALDSLPVRLIAAKLEELK